MSTFAGAHRRGCRTSIYLACLTCLVCLVSLTSGVAQQPAYLVAGSDSSLNVYNLSTNALIEKIDQGAGERVVAIGPNSRLAFLGCSSFLSVIDLTLGREIRRIHNVYPSPSGNSMAFTRDGKWLLVADAGNQSLTILDAASFNRVRQFPLAGVMGMGATQLNSVVIAGSKAYVTTSFPDPNNPAIAVLDLSTFVLKPVAIPGGFNNYAGIGVLPNAVATPDGRYVLMMQEGIISFISTATDTVAMTNALTYSTAAILMNSTLNPNSQYAYFLVADNVNFSVMAFDLRPGSPTYGQLLPATETFLPYTAVPSGASISPDGRRIVVSQFQSSSSPTPNTFVIDTAKMLSDPSHAIVSQVTVAGGGQLWGNSLANISTVASPAAPTVTGVSGNVTNDAPQTIHVFGTNFAFDAQVRIGAMANLAATVHGTTDLEVTIPANAPAGPGLDVIVTNPNLTVQPTAQNQSGLLPHGLTIFLNPAFHPANGIGVRNNADGTLSAFDFSQRAMKSYPLLYPSYDGVTFNLAGTDLYTVTNGSRYASATTQVEALKVASGADTPIIVDGFRFRGYDNIVASRNPFSGGPSAVVYAIAPAYGYSDTVVSMIDADPSSPTFNTVLHSFNAQMDPEQLYFPFSGAVTPDGRYLYVNNYIYTTGETNIAIFDIVNGGPATLIDPTSFGAAPQQFDMVVSPDGRSLLLNAFYGSIAVLDITHPLNPALVTTIHGLANSVLFSYQVVGNRLYTLDVNSNIVFAYNFDRAHSNFTRLGSYLFQGTFSGNPYIAVSPDGSFVYLPIGGNDVISVLDANKLATGQQALVTNLAAFRDPTVVTVSPATH